MKSKVLGAVAAMVAVTALLAGCTTTSSSHAGSSSTPSASPTPTVARATSISPKSGALTGGQTATITGTNLTGVTAVAFNGVASPKVTVTDATTVEAVVPSAVDYQPSAGAVVLKKGATTVASAKSLTYSWASTTAVDKEMQYAFAHWNAPTYNTAYYNFDAVGGDCQNFVSQSLLAAGLAKSSSWYYDSEADHSSSWGYAPAFDSLAPSLGFTRLSADQRSQLSVGDLAYFDWNANGVPDHVMIVSQVSTVDGKTTVKLVGHNLDYDYRDLDTTITKDHPGATVWFYKLPASLTK